MTQTELPDDKYFLTISGLGINVERMIDGQTLAAIMAIVMGTDNLIAPASADASVSTPSADGAVVRKSLREFLDEVGAKRKPHQIAAIGHYIMDFERNADFSREEVKARFSAAREPMPANFPRDFALAERAGMLAEMHGKEGRYYITKTGLAAIEAKFSKEKAK